jgi:hypothetical protein
MNRTFLISLVAFICLSCVDITVHEEVVLIFVTGNCHEESREGLLSSGSAYEVCKATFEIAEKNEHHDMYEETEVSVDGEMAKRIVNANPRYGDGFVGVIRWRSRGEVFDFPKVLDLKMKEERDADADTL